MEMAWDYTSDMQECPNMVSGFHPNGVCGKKRGQFCCIKCHIQWRCSWYYGTLWWLYNLFCTACCILLSLLCCLYVYTQSQSKSTYEECPSKTLGPSIPGHRIPHHLNSRVRRIPEFQTSIPRIWSSVFPESWILASWDPSSHDHVHIIDIVYVLWAYLLIDGNLLIGCLTIIFSSVVWP